MSFCYDKCMSEKIKPLYDEVPFGPDKPYEIGRWREIPEVVHDEHEIKGFFGPYRWLSNFGKAVVQLDGVIYPSVEVAYQAAKHAPQDRAYFLDCSSKESITYNRATVPSFYSEDEWEVVKVEVMKYLLEQKYNPNSNPESYQSLIETEGKYLEETNWWGDTFWGKNLKGEGLNTLGKLIMAIRGSYFTQK